MSAIVKNQWGFHFALSFNIGHDLFFGINTDLGINPNSITDANMIWELNSPAAQQQKSRINKKSNQLRTTEICYSGKQ